jgi:flagellar export protein FliJ
MKRFRFTLAALQVWRERLEQAALEHYGEALRREAQAQAKLRSVDRERETVWNQRRNQFAAGAPVDQILHLQNYSQALEGQRREAELAASAAQRQTQYRLQQLLAARKQREVVDRFEERQVKRYQREIERQEQKALDELACLRAAAADGGAQQSRLWN